MYSYSWVNEKILYFYCIFQEVITATGNRVETCFSDVKFFYGFRTRCCIYLRIPGLVELAVNNSRRRVTCRNSCFSTAFSATAIFTGWDSGRSRCVVGRTPARNILYPLAVCARTKSLTRVILANQAIWEWAETRVRMSATNERRYFGGQMKPCTGLKDIRTSGTPYVLPPKWWCISQKAPLTYLSSLSSRSMLEDTARRSDAKETRKYSRCDEEFIPYVPNFRARSCSLAWHLKKIHLTRKTFWFSGKKKP